MNILSLSTHPLVDWRLGKVFQSTKICWSFTGKRCCCQLPNNWSKWWPESLVPTANTWELDLPSNWSSRYCELSLCSPTRVSDSVCACTREHGSLLRSCRLQWTVRLKTWCRDVSQNNLTRWGCGTLGLLQMSSMEAFYVFVLYFLCIWKLFIIRFNCLRDHCKGFFFPLWNSSSVFGQRNFTWSFICIRMSR